MKAAALLLASILATAVAAAQAWTAPRTPWGDPDLGGIWNYATMTPLERPRQFAGQPVLSAADAAAYEAQTLARRGEANNTAGPDWWDPGTAHLTDRRTSLVVDPADGRVPPPAGARRGGRGRAGADNPEDRSLKERCLSDGRPHTAARQWMGDSRGHWDGDTLVVDTIHFLPEYEFRGASEHLHLVERFTRTSLNRIDYVFTVDDPTVWSAAWTAAFPMTRVEGPMFEYACHEGNARSMIGMLEGARVEEGR